MSSPTWNDIALVLPADGEIVWIRRLMVNYPMLAAWNESSSVFIAPNGLSIPWYMIGKWRVQ